MVDGEKIRSKVEGMVMLTQRQIQQLKPDSKIYKRGCGDGLFVYVEKTYKGIEGNKRGGGKYFKGRYKNSEVQIGKFGTSFNEFSLKSAHSEWEKIKSWSLKTKQSVSKYKNHQNQKIEKESHTLKEAIDFYLSDGLDVKPFTLQTYKNQLNNRVLGNISPHTTLKELEWDNGGREIITKVIQKIKEQAQGNGVDQSERCQELLNAVFNFAIEKGWMKRGQNPATKFKRKRSRENHHPTLDWNEVPKLIADINLNKCNSHIQTVLATKFLLMTFLRTGALARLEWEWIIEKDGIECFEIPGKTHGLKRRKDVNDHIPHYVPLSNEMKQILEVCSQYNDDSKYVFQPIRQSRYPHLDPESPNNYLKNLGYSDKQRAHGWRRTARTYAIDLLGCDSDVIKRQMGHLPDNKVDRAYDRSLRLKDRKKLMDDWCKLLTENGLKI